MFGGDFGLPPAPRAQVPRPASCEYRPPVAVYMLFMVVQNKIVLGPTTESLSDVRPTHLLSSIYPSIYLGQTPWDANPTKTSHPPSASGTQTSARWRPWPPANEKDLNRQVWLRFAGCHPR